MLFEYKAKNLKGETVKGIVDALNQEAAMEVLTSRDLIILSLAEGGRMSILRRPLNFKMNLFSGVKPKDLVFLSRQLSTMVSAGLPLVKCLEILVKQTNDPYLQGVVGAIAEDVRGGIRFSSALAKYPKVFNDFYINMVRAGETAGRLDEVLNYLANEQEKNFDLMNKIKGAMIYPLFIIIMVISVMILMMLFVIPQLTSVLEESGAQLPMSTQFLINTSKFLQHFAIFLIPLIIALVAFLRYFFKTPKGKRLWDKFILKAPVFGSLFQNLYLVRFTRSLSTLLVGGIPLTSALKIVAEVVENSIYKDLIFQTIRDVEEGRSISSTLVKSNHIPKMVSHLLSVGEETGKLDEVLGRLADFYSREVENILSKLVTLLEPIIIIFLGVVVGGMMAAIILPMYKLASSF